MFFKFVDGWKMQSLEFCKTHFSCQVGLLYYSYVEIKGVVPLWNVSVHVRNFELKIENCTDSCICSAEVAKVIVELF